MTIEFIERCLICSEPLPDHVLGRPRKYCSDACKKKMYRRRRREKVKLLRDQGQEWYVRRRWVDYRSPFPGGH